MWEIRKYNPDDKQNWDAFVEQSRNATFLFKRDYMDYHAERFPDHSLMAIRNGRLSAMLPATREGSLLSSHAGLTYGGWIFPPSGLDVDEIFVLWKAFLNYCASQEISDIIYKPLPYIYATMPSEEDRYLLFLSGASPERRDISSTIDLQCNPGFNTLQRRHLRHIPKSSEIQIVTSAESNDVASFYNLLSRCLGQRHEARPVHTLSELQYLMDKFPENIKIWGIYLDGEIHAGICAYITKNCLHCQYIATSEEGREKNLMAALVAEIREYCKDKGIRYLDFGISNEKDGRVLNSGLNRQKTSYGASGVVYDRYRISVASALASLPISLWPPR